MSNSPKIILFTAVYSDNLGDGVIATSMAQLIHEHAPNADITHIDIAGRTQYATQPQGLKTLFMKLRSKLPSFILDLVMLLGWYWKLRRPITQTWEAQLPKEADMVIFGGGQLFLDENLNFPLKINLFTKIIRSRFPHIPIHIYGCGVSRKWSGLAHKLFSRLLTDPHLDKIYVRDFESVDALSSRFPSLAPNILHGFDSALCASLLKQNVTPIYDVGINIACPLGMKKSAKDGHNFTEERFLSLWKDVITGLTKKEYKVAIFTNGAFEDERFMSVLRQTIPDNLWVEWLERPQTPHMLIDYIAQMRSVVAHRLHANIIAYALSIPSIGMVWDKKVSEFGRLTERDDFFLENAQQTPEIILDRIDALSYGLKDNQRLSKMQVDIRQKISTLFA